MTGAGVCVIINAEYMRLPYPDLPKKINKPNNNLFSWVTIAFAAYIVISAAFIQQVWQFLSKIIGESNLELISISICLLVGMHVLLYFIKLHLKDLRIIVSIFLLISAFLFSWKQPYFVEKLHVLEYGILGWLVAKDLRRIPYLENKKIILYSIIFILIAGTVDEIFQSFLPYRVGEVRDVITNVISGSFGIALFLIK